MRMCEPVVPYSGCSGWSAMPTFGSLGNSVEERFLLDWRRADSGAMDPWLLLSTPTASRRVLPGVPCYTLVASHAAPCSVRLAQQCQL